MLLRLALLAFAACLTACGTTAPPVPLDALQRGDLGVLRSFYEEELADGDEENEALFLNGLAQVELLEGNLDEARRSFERASRIMGNWQTSAGEEISAIVGDESSKTWKGDPHEKAMNAFYRGFLFWLKGEPDNARAAFLGGIFSDAESEEGDSQVDFSLLYWLAGRMSQAQGIADAEDFYADAQKARQFAVQHGARGRPSPPLLQNPGAGNLVCLVELDLGPRKYAGGEQNSLALIAERGTNYQAAEIYCDGKSLGRTTLLADLNYQAKTRGGKEMQGIRKGKAVFKTGAAVGGALLLNEGLKANTSHRNTKLIAGGALVALSLLTSASADVRHWEALPQTVHALTADVDPGAHRLRVDFIHINGSVGLSQNWTIEVPERGQSMWLFRSLPGLDVMARTQE